MNIPAAPLQYLREVWQQILNELRREDDRNLKRDVAETHTSSLKIMGLLDLSDATAGQIKFPATQNASSDANTLDDYEEGTFTPTLGDGTNNYTLSKALGWYTKNGNRVSGEAACTWTALGSAGAGQLKLGALPFTSANVTNYEAAASVSYVEGLDTTASLKQVTLGIGTNAAFLGFLLLNDNAAPGIVVSNASSAAGSVTASFCYRV